MAHLLVAGKLHPSGVALLSDLKSEGVTYDYVEEVSEESYQQYLHAADALIIRTQPLTAASIRKAEKLKVVSRHGVGYDSVDIDALNERGIALTIVGDVNSISVAEHAFMQLLAASKQMLRADRSVREGKAWNWRNQLQQREITGKNLLIVGYGRSGKHLARMARGFDMHIRAYDPYLQQNGWPEGDVDCAPDLKEALAWADCVSLHVPKGEQPLLGEAELEHAKRGIILANCSRGGVIDEAALTRALLSGRVAAAGLDVFAEEPPKGTSSILSNDNAILSPHIAGLTEEAAMRMATASILNAVAFLKGDISPSLVVNSKHIAA